MARRIKEKLVSDDKQVTLDIRYNQNWQEYIVRWNEQGVGFDEGKSYHTDDADDALGTMRLSMKQYNEAHPMSKDQETNKKLADIWNFLVDNQRNGGAGEQAEWKAAMAAIDKLSNRYDDYVLGNKS